MLTKVLLYCTHSSAISAAILPLRSPPIAAEKKSWRKAHSLEKSPDTCYVEDMGTKVQVVGGV
ncbi:hypothetical protein RRF57_004541 [Xylaria bambusicola]|uniref:Uncharacterized protein n=1 Tax=Xylaria bambusicola TaxID=326684 RepID=A0AAN7UNZ8_9PEZI